MKNKINYLLIITAMYSCSPEPKTNDFIGTWNSSDGASIKLYENEVCEITNLNYKKIYSFNDTPSVLHCKGVWNFKNVNDEPVIDITYKKGGTYTYNGQIRHNLSGFHLSISGEGFFENRPPWKLFVFVGDPDDMNKYEFVKKQ